MSIDRERGSQLYQEIKMAGDWSDLGMFDQITKENFPLFGEFYPQRLTDYKILAYQSAYRLKNNVRQAVRHDPEAFRRISLEMQQFAKKASNLAKRIYKKGEEDNKGYQNIFWMNNEERFSVEAAIGLGFPEVINSINFPSLGAISKQHLKRLKLEALKVDETRWKGLMTEANPILGFTRIEGDDVIFLDEARKAITEIATQRDLLLETTHK